MQDAPTSSNSPLKSSIKPTVSPKLIDSVRKLRERLNSTKSLDGVSIPPPEPFPLSDIFESQSRREWELAEASGRLLEQRVDRIEDQLKELRPSPMRDFLLCTLSAVISGLIVFSIQQLVSDSKQEPQISTERNADDDAKKQDEKVLNVHQKPLHLQRVKNVTVPAIAPTTAEKINQ